MEELTERQIQAAKMILEYVDIEPTDANVRRYVAREVLDFTEDEHGHYCWYMDDEGTELCIHVETLEEIETEDVY